MLTRVQLPKVRSAVNQPSHQVCCRGFVDVHRLFNKANARSQMVPTRWLELNPVHSRRPQTDSSRSKLHPPTICHALLAKKRVSISADPPTAQSMSSTSNLNNRPCFRYVLLQSRRHEPVVQSGLVGTTRIRSTNINKFAWLRWKNQRRSRRASILCLTKLESYPQRAPSSCRQGLSACLQLPSYFAMATR